MKRTDDYGAFLASKRVAVADAGIDPSACDLSIKLFDWQREIVRWALRRGRAAIFADCGLGKSFMQIEWANALHHATGGDILILAPLAVTAQTVAEGEKLGVTIHACRAQKDVKPGVNITNYEMLEKFDTTRFVGVVLDESSILKAYTGKTKQSLVERFAETPYRLCCTATPAPNDIMELGNHSEFLGVMPSGEMLMRWFINDTMAMGNYRLKGHAEKDFWDWVASWAIGVRTPSDLGYSDDGFTLPPLEITQHLIETDLTIGREDGQLFRAPKMSATNIHRELRLSAVARAQAVADLVNADDEPWTVWCYTNYEADALKKVIPGAIEVRGSETPAAKERKLLAFTRGEARVIITKPGIAGFGLNWQHCHKTAFVGLSYSFEEPYQAIRRHYRFGQTQPVEVHIVVGETETPLVASFERKLRAHDGMANAMSVSASRLALGKALELRRNETFTAERGRDWTLYHGDCVAVTRSLADASIGFSIFSPPFSNLYTYSDAIEDMGNSAGDDEFFAHFDFLIPELLRVTRPGRLCAVHCKQLVNYKGRDGAAGLRDFRGEIIRHFVAAGWAYHSEVCIWKDPVIEMQRTKAHGLLYKQLRADSTFSRQGMAEYLLVFRKWAQSETDDALVAPVSHTSDSLPLDVWQRYASPVWMDIRQTRVLNVEQARESHDEKHICPLQLDVIDRALDLWTNPGDTVLDPFNGIASTGVQALAKHRRYVGAELKRAYVNASVKHLRRAELETSRPTLWDDLMRDVVGIEMGSEVPDGDYAIASAS